MKRKRNFPSQVVGILQTCVHSLSSSRGVYVCCVAGEEDTVLVDKLLSAALIDSESGEPQGFFDVEFGRVDTVLGQGFELVNGQVLDGFGKVLTVLDLAGFDLDTDCTMAERKEMHCAFVWVGDHTKK